MFGWIAAAVIGVVALVSGPSTPDWSKVYEKVTPSIVSLYAGDRPVCTLTAIEGDWWLTTKHCFRPGEVYRSPGFILHMDKAKEKGELVAIPRLMGVPALKLHIGNPDPGTPIAALGYGWETETTALITLGHTLGLVPELRPPPGSNNIIYWYDVKQLGGMSGGPVVDKDGKLLTLVWFDRWSRGPGEIVAGSVVPTSVQAFVTNLE